MSNWPWALQIIQQGPPIFRSNASAPLDHFVKLAIPLRSCEALLENKPVVVTDETGRAEIGWRRRVRGAIFDGTRIGTGAHINVCERDNVPQIEIWKERLHQIVFHFLHWSSSEPLNRSPLPVAPFTGSPQTDSTTALVTQWRQKDGADYTYIRWIKHNSPASVRWSRFGSGGILPY